MKKETIWKGENKDEYSTAKETPDTDVAIIGAGITGLTTGYLLAKAGVKSVIFEAQFIGNGTSGSSTGNLYVPVDEMYHSIAKKFDTATAKGIAKSRDSACRKIKSIIRDHNFNCAFNESSFYLVAETEEHLEKVEREYETCKKIDIQANYLDHLEEYPGDVKGVLHVPDQAQFNPKEYLKQLGRLYTEAGGKIYSGTPVRKVEGGKEGSPFLLHGDEFKASAMKVVHATHSPKGISILHTLLGPYREYVLAAKLKAPFQKGIYWTQQNNHHYSVRIFQEGENYHLLCLGEPHKVGQAENNKAHLERIESYLRKHFDVGEIDYCWGAQHYKSADKVPYIGRLPSDNRVFVATGFSTDGLVYGTFAGMLITDLITHTVNEFTDIYDPSRTNPLKSAKRFIKENTNLASQFVKDYPFKGDVKELEDIPPGEGKLVKQDGNDYAAYRNESGEITITSAICPHLGCVVHWNGAEKSWDCPCHGSRFDPDGEVLEGPSYEGLKKIQP